MQQNFNGQNSLDSQASQLDENAISLLQDDPPQPNPPIQPRRLCPEYISQYANEEGNYVSDCFKKDNTNLQNKMCAGCSLWFKQIQLKSQYYSLEGVVYTKNLVGMIGDYTTGFFLYFVGMYLISKKKFDRYPYKLFAIALLSQAVCSFNFVNVQFFIHPTLYRIVAYTMRISQIKFFQFDDEDQLSVRNWQYFLFRKVTYQQEYKAFLLLVDAWKVIQILSQQVSLAYNVCIYYDTYKILSNPFYPARKRQKFYILYVSIIIIATIVILQRGFFDWTSLSLVAYIPKEVDNPQKAEIPHGQMINLFAVLIIIQLSIIFLCFLRTICILCRAGTSQQAKKRAMRFHFYYLFILFFSQVLTIQHTFTDYWNDQFDKYLFDCHQEEDQNEVCNEYKYFAWVILLRYIGIILGILRLTDPFVFQEFKKDLVYTKNKFNTAFTSCFQKICCCKHKKEDEINQRKTTKRNEKRKNFSLNQSQGLENSQMTYSPIFSARSPISQAQSPISSSKTKREKSFLKKIKDQKPEKGKKKQNHMVQETINGFLNTAMNIEFVYTILLGINTFMECQIQSQNEQYALQENYQNDETPFLFSQRNATQKDSQNEKFNKDNENLYFSQTTTTKKIGAHANYQIKQKDQAINIKIMDVTMYDAQKFDVDQDLRAESEQNESEADQAFDQDYRLKDSHIRGKDKFDFPSDRLIFDESLTMKDSVQSNMIKQNQSNNNQIQRLSTGKLAIEQNYFDKEITRETPAFQPFLHIQQKKETKQEHLQLPQGISFESQKNLISTAEVLNKISIDSEDLSRQNKQNPLKRQFSGRTDLSNRKSETDRTESLKQTMSVLGSNIKVNYGDKDQQDELSVTQSLTIHPNFVSKIKRQNLITKILQMESRDSYRLKDTDFAEDIIFDPVEVNMKNGDNREVNLALRFRHHEVQKKESFFMPKVISVESRTNNQKKNFKNSYLTGQGRPSIQNKLFHELNFEQNVQQAGSQNQSGFKRQLSNKSQEQGYSTKHLSSEDSIPTTLLFDASNLKKSQAKSQKEKTKMSIKLKTEIECLEPQKFAQIMEMDGINPQDVIKSLSIEANHKQLFKAGEGSGQSGSFFFFSWDKKLLIKTLRGKEKKNLLNMLDEMIDYFKRVNNNSLLARIYGCFTIKSNYFPDLDVIVMQNATQLIAPKLSDIINFDLKGSTKGRKTRMQEENAKFWRQKMNFKGTLKDLNLVEIINDKGSAVIEITEAQFDSFEFIIRRDSQFLRNHNLMDYSLLLTIEQVPCTKDQYDQQQAQLQEKKKQKKIMLFKKRSDVVPYNQSLLETSNDNKLSNQNRKTLGDQASIKDLLHAPSISDLQEYSLRVHKDHFQAYDNFSSLISTDVKQFISSTDQHQFTQQSADMITSSRSKIKNSVTSKENNKSQQDSELEIMNQEFKDNAQFRNFLKTQIIKEQVVKKEELWKSNRITYKLNQLHKSDKQQREDTLRIKKQLADQKRKKTQKKLGESYESGDKEEEVEYKYYRQVAHLAIIDYLQEWSIMKKLENVLRRFTLSKQQINTISAVDPELYQSRFENFMVQQFLKPGREKFMSQEQKNYTETCNEFIMKLAYDIRMSELEIDKGKGFNFITLNEDEQLKIIGEIGRDGRSGVGDSFGKMQQQRYSSETQQSEVVVRQSEQFQFESMVETPPQKQTLGKNQYN